MVILYYNFYVTNCNLFSVDVSVSVNSSITGRLIYIFDKTSILVFTIAGYVVRLGNIKTLTT